MMYTIRERNTLTDNRPRVTTERRSYRELKEVLENSEEHTTTVPTTRDHSESQRITTEEFKVKVRSYI